MDGNSHTDSDAPGVRPDTEVETVTFAEWQRSRPLVGAALLVLGGAAIALFPLGALLQFDATLMNVLGLLTGFGIFLSGVTVTLVPERSTPVALFALALSASSFLFALGGLVVGMGLAGVGGVLCFAWSPPEEEADGVDGTA